MVSKKLAFLGLATALALAGCDKAKEDHSPKKEESHKEAPKQEAEKPEVKKPEEQKEEGKPTSQAPKAEQSAKAEALTDEEVAKVAKVAKNAVENMLKDPKVQKIKGHQTLMLEPANSTKEQIDLKKLVQAQEAVLKEQKKFIVLEANAKAAKHPNLILGTKLVQNTTKEGVENMLVLRLVNGQSGQELWKAELPILHAEPQARAGR
ncbi:hypothetical protein [Helicobacter ailurogastricus]|uniref:Lipoprotein n=1 Tax=Helicobacter ailurogastricus TaxID=1578720 RepID=A0A0K2X9J7_9HELI|nr:hypothetical protein [Helicobacter ailurogastricus]CRF40299.1 hypothetical protein HAL011_00510 [Helicobacter ailurogastricus]CRF43187.1 hypothetical protein HAL013_14110 [Helicobacter ailurogastricus]CRF44117.1 hypothetical protein HAL09_06860 [Helicobacter ailurogastricus]